ncbi:hypothetical protein E8E11_009958 [Didymella keratinophila]|nr:hypothetical protein E8E11_009958 [Didymella keratinophila]
MQRYRSLDDTDEDAWQLEEYESDYRRPDVVRESLTANLVPNKDASDVSVIGRSASSTSVVGEPLRHFYFRTAVGILGPLLVLCYFLAIWRVYLAPIDEASSLAFGPPGATWVFYSWFVAGVIGLNLSMYGLAGIEAAMLMEPRWNVGDAMRLMMHADSTWSGPGGWMKTMKWIFQTRKAGVRQRHPGKLWFVLAIPSILVFIAWPLSGLCLETTSGFLHGTKAGGANVAGFSYANFNERNSDDAYQGAGVTWTNALDARIPGQGIVYTPEGFDRSQHPFLEKLPVVFPKDDGVNRMFLTAQAEAPIEGDAWGLLLQYNCSIVERLSDLSIIKDRVPATDNGILNATYGQRTYYVQGNTSTIYVQNQTDPAGYFQANNIHAVAEIAHQLYPSKDAYDRLLASSSNAMFSETAGCYFNKNESITGDYPGIDQERIFEIVLWQQMFNSSYGDAAPPSYNFSIDHNITELHGAYDYHDFQYTLPKNSSQGFPNLPMTAIGVQCKSSSSVGTADINGVRSTYSNFIRTDTPINVQRSRCAGRFGVESPRSMIPAPSTDPSTEEDWLNNFFTSTAAPPLFYASYTDDPESVDTGTGYMLRLNYLQASQLRQSMLRAHAAYAVQLMYNGGQGFTARDGSHVTLFNPNITSFVAGTVIKRGVMPVGPPLALFFLWALTSMTLCAMYGFRKRWSAILDGHTLFRLGVNLEESDRRAIQRFSSVAEIEDCHALNDVPALVGDLGSNSRVGRIGLVKANVAAKGKLYQ